MYHLVARGEAGRLLFSDWIEGARLWTVVTAAFRRPAALVLMPNHLHLVVEDDGRLRLAAALSGYVRWRNARRGESGAVLAPLPPAERIADPQKVRRVVRYVHLNPCRARLGADPLSWPFSTHRDATGFAIPAVGTVRADRARFHAYVSADPTVHVEGTELPSRAISVPTAREVLDAVSALTRTPLGPGPVRGAARDLFLRAARALCAEPHAELGALVGVSRRTVLRAPRGADPEVRVVAAVVGDPRFAPLDARTLGWARGRR